ncbi:HDOD domain-containing protein [Timonella senegalensis]|uniref:HDOD domain-containing protein n=2 Tax=Timonella senegalensis TaxID=1465825 RepID=UPI0028AD362C|nr:HDOD domain-containing protein [Timonella senegalensis]
MRSTLRPTCPFFRLALNSADGTRKAYVLVPVHVIRAFEGQPYSPEVLGAQYDADVDQAALAADAPTFLWIDDSFGIPPIELPSTFSGVIVEQFVVTNNNWAQDLLELTARDITVLVHSHDPATLPTELAASAAGIVVNPGAATNQPDGQIIWTLGHNLSAQALAGRMHIGPVHTVAAQSGAELAPGDAQCLRAMQLLSDSNTDFRDVAAVLNLDPVIAVRALHMANSAAFGLSNRLDSLQSALTFLGTGRINTLLLTSLISSRQPDPDLLWFLLNRAETCRRLSGGGDAAYMAGLVSSLADETGTDPLSIAEQAGASQYIQSAFSTAGSGLGAVLRAVKAYELGDIARIRYAGLDPEAVASAYFESLPHTRIAITQLLAAGH